LLVKPGEFLTDWVRPGVAQNLAVEAFTACNQCLREPFRIIIIESLSGKRRGVSVCRIHFEEAAENTPDLV